jgi:acetyl-CoA C-acetyltransferase/acetyl-CoA acyltransferase
MPTPVILGAVRTPMVRAGDALQSVPAKELARQAVRELLEIVDLPAADVNEIVLGNAGGPADAPNIARVVGLLAGLPESVPGVTVHRNCASGLEAILVAAEKVAAGRAEFVIAGGAESMSRIPMLFPPEANPWFARWARAKSLGQRVSALGALRLKEMAPKSAILEGLTDPVCGLSMGSTAENLAREFDISRDAQDAYALESHRRAVAARAEGRFDDEIAPVWVGPEFRSVVERDIGPREDASLERLAKLRPVFDRRDGTVTAGNSCQITDGAAAVLVAAEETVLSRGMSPMARIRSWSTVGLSPARMGLGPAFAIPDALDRAGVTLADVGRIEINEAFAAQVLACEIALASDRFAADELGRSRAVGELGRERLNVRGGAIALGHPIGATGARLTVTLLAELARSGERLGCASLCVGGGQGSAIVVERLQ